MDRPASNPDATVVRPRAAREVDPDATVLRPVAPASRRDDPDATVIVALAPPAEVPARGQPALPRSPILALSPGLRLHEYRIDRVLGQGGFGITYLATDVHLNAAVAIKEYLPEEIAFRAGDRSVSPNASRHRDRYRAGLESFLVEARTLASFRHPAIVRVARFFEAHRTAYMVMEYEQGSPFKTWWPQHAGLGEPALVELLLPLLDGLAVVHAAGFLHRDIKPDNIQVRASDGSLVLLDFGSAGQTVAVAEQGAVVLTPGYAPIEQYGLGQQGAWTDLYALAATLYWAVAGRKPPDAEMRAVNPGAMVPAEEAGRGRWGRAFLQAIDWALNPDPARRPQSVAEFRRALCADHLSSLALPEALQRGDSQLEAEARAPRERVQARLRRGLRTLHTPRDWPLALKLSLAMVATALLPMALTAGYNLQQSQAALGEAELRFVEQMAHSTAGRIAQWVADTRHLLRSLGTDSDFAALLLKPDEAAHVEMRDKLARLAQANPDVQLLMLLDAAGTAVAASDASLQGRSFAFRSYFQEALRGGSFASGYNVAALGSSAGEPGAFYAEPVRAGDGHPAGVLVLRVRGAAIGAILAEVGHDSALTPILVDGDGVILQHPRPGMLYRSLAPLPESTLAALRADQRFGRDRIDSLGETALAQAMDGARSTGHLSYHSAQLGADEIAGYSPVAGSDWVVGVVEPRATFEAPLQRLKTVLGWSVALVGLLFTGLALRFARGIVRPIRGLTAAADALKAGDYAGATVDVKSRDEVGQLGRTFNVMIDVLRQRDRERKRD